MTPDEMRRVLAEVRYKDWEILVHDRPDDPTRRNTLYLQVHASTVDNEDLTQRIQWSGRKWLVSKHMTKSELVATAFLAIQTAVEHETRELFKYRGVSIYSPHYDVDALARLRRDETNMDERTNDV